MVTAASRNHWGHTFNVGSGLECSNEELVAIVARLTDRAIATKTGDFPTRPTDQAHRKPDLDKSSALLNWVPKYDLRAGVAATLRWYAQNPDVWSLDNAPPPLAV
jgi:nucleoside-diphosphate-sugar epimerase